MLIRIAVAFALFIGTAQAAESIKPQRGEGDISFRCRAALIPGIRQCTRECEVSPDEDARAECVHACTTRGLWEIAQCRSGDGADPAVALR